MIGSWRPKSQCPMWPPPVVVGAELGEDPPQVSLAEDQDAVGEFGSDGQHESFGEAVRSGTSGRDPHRVYPVSTLAPAKMLSKAVVNWPARSRTRNRNVVARSSRSIRSGRRGAFQQQQTVEEPVEDQIEQA